MRDDLSEPQKLKARRAHAESGLANHNHTNLQFISTWMHTPGAQYNGPRGQAAREVSPVC